MLHDKPIMYKYAQVSGQVINVPIQLLNTKNSLRNSKDLALLRGHLIRRIEYIRYQAEKAKKYRNKISTNINNRAELNNKISYYTDKKNKNNIGIFELLGATENSLTAANYKKRKDTIRTRQKQY